MEDPSCNRAASAKCCWSRAVCGLSPSASAALRGRRRLLLLRERASQRTALLPGARAHCISVPRSAAQKRGRVSDTTAALAVTDLLLERATCWMDVNRPRTLTPVDIAASL